ncbi:MAG: VanW family protein [Defluviitaleaceae bacterium]|nr:VanW family protein [Defluviitaleaceae bacterium]
MRRPISSFHPFLYFTIVKLRRFIRRITWWFGKQKFAKTVSPNPLKYRVYKHQLVSIRLGDTALQKNKVENLKIAVNKLNGVLIHPGETFSLCWLLGCATKRKGYLEANTIQNGRVVARIGGGLCKLPILINWICLHSPLTVLECHQHSFDPFPDEPGVIPSGSGPTFFYNYLDYQFKNNTNYTFQFLFWQENEYLCGDLRVDTELPYKYYVFEANDHFVKAKGNFYRKNEVWRHKYETNSHEEPVETQLIYKNNSLVKYVPDEYISDDS